MIPLDHADVGNSVGLPMCPGVEVTWSVKNPAIYEKPYHIKHKPKDLENYFKEYCEKGLNPDRDETAPEESPDGCEPGDLTKRMAIPWTSDLFECNIQRINFTDEDKNLDKDQLEKAPTYLSYWWPPQSPWDVILGVTDPTEDEEEIDEMERKKRVIEELKDAGVPAGQQVNYIRGINTHMEMVRGWWHLGFILNQNEGKDREKYPYFVEKERNHKAFKVVSLATGDKGNIGDVKEARFIAAFYLKEEDEKPSRIKYTT
jgi:L-lysine 6-oxidase